MRWLVAVAIGVVLAFSAYTSHAARAIGAHWMLIVVITVLGFGTLSGITFAIMKGAEKHTVQTWGTTTSQVKAMPAPAEHAALPAARPFVMEGAIEAEIESDVEAEVAAEPEPGLCEGPSCAGKLGDEAVDVIVSFDGEPDKPDETHHFCSEACAREWEDNDIEQRAAGALG